MLNVLRTGYILPFASCPPYFYAENNNSSITHSTFVTNVIHDLLRSDLITEVPEKPRCINPLTVSGKHKLRLVLDLRHVNNYVTTHRFRYEDLKTLAAIVEKADFFVNFDFKSGDHHIDIHPAHQTYLGFAWTFEDGTARYFVFTVLPFGLCSASYVFTKVLRPFTKLWRGMGLKTVLYTEKRSTGQEGRGDHRVTSDAGGMAA